MPSISGAKPKFLEPYPAHHVASFPMHVVFIVVSTHYWYLGKKNSIKWA